MGQELEHDRQFDADIAELLIENNPLATRMALAMEIMRTEVRWTLKEKMSLKKFGELIVATPIRMVQDYRDTMRLARLNTSTRAR